MLCDALNAVSEPPAVVHWPLTVVVAPELTAIGFVATVTVSTVGEVLFRSSNVTVELPAAEADDAVVVKRTNIFTSPCPRTCPKRHESLASEHVAAGEELTPVAVVPAGSTTATE